MGRLGPTFDVRWLLESGAHHGCLWTIHSIQATGSMPRSRCMGHCSVWCRILENAQNILLYCVRCLPFFYAKFVSLLCIWCPAVSMMYVGIIDCSIFYMTVHSIDGLVHCLKNLEVIDPSNTANSSQSIGQTRSLVWLDDLKSQVKLISLGDLEWVCKPCKWNGSLLPLARPSYLSWIHPCFTLYIEKWGPPWMR